MGQVNNKETNLTSTSNQPEEQPYLYAGKFSTPKELEDAYLSSSGEALKIKASLNEIQKKTEVPKEYLVETHVKEILGDNIIKYVEIAKEAQLTQEQFNKVLGKSYENIKTQADHYEESKKTIGDNTLNVLNDYIKKYYPEPVRDVVMDKIILDKTAREKLMQHRDVVLNSSVPGVSAATAVGAQNRITKLQLLEISQKSFNDPNNMALREQVVELHKAYAAQQAVDNAK